MRLDATGARDPSFGDQRRRDDPLRRVDRDQSRPQARAATGRQDGDGRRRRSRSARSSQCGVARFDANGDARRRVSARAGTCWCRCPSGCFNVNQQSDGKLVIVGNDQVGDVIYGTFVRLLLNGALDPTFGTGGLLRHQQFRHADARCIHVQRTISSRVLRSRIRRTACQKSYVVELPRHARRSVGRPDHHVRRASRPGVRRRLHAVRHGELGIGGVVRGERRLLDRRSRQCRAAHRRGELHDHREPGRQRHLPCGHAGGAHVCNVTQANQVITFGRGIRRRHRRAALGQDRCDEHEHDGGAIDDPDRVHIADTVGLHDGWRLRRAR